MPLTIAEKVTHRQQVSYRTTPVLQTCASPSSRFVTTKAPRWPGFCSYYCICQTSNSQATDQLPHNIKY
jgi:hypothetical protein